MRRPLFLAALLCTLALAAPADGQAYVLDGSPWPDETLTYRSSGGTFSRSVDRAARALNRAHLGYRFRRTAGYADMRISRRGFGCGGTAVLGARGRDPAWIEIGSQCGPNLTVLVLVHEFGHVMGLGHERRRCARMNSTFGGGSGTPRHCRRHSLRFWLRRPFLRDDVRGARAAHRQLPLDWDEER